MFSLVRNLEVPILCISGTKDWLIYQNPGAIENMKGACPDFRGIAWIEGAGHWPQQKAPERVIEEALRFLHGGSLHNIYEQTRRSKYPSPSPASSANAIEHCRTAHGAHRPPIKQRYLARRDVIAIDLYHIGVSTF